MDPKSVSETVKASIEPFSEHIKSSPHAVIAGDNIAKTAATITEAVNNLLLPVAAVNFAFSKARSYFERQFEQDLGAYVSEIPEESLVMPKPSIAAPALNGLAFSFEEEDLKDMYLRLLASSMDARKEWTNHPAYVEIIRQLSSYEAHILKSALKSNGAIPIACINRATDDRKGYRTLYEHLINYRDDSRKHFITDDRLPLMIENWNRLGIVRYSYDHSFTEKNIYDWIVHRPEYIKIQNEYKDEPDRLQIKYGVLQITSFGKGFAKSISIENI